MSGVQELCRALRSEVGKVVVGQEVAVERILVAILSDGHVLLEGVPGLAKTTLVRALAAAIRLEFGRVQFTPDLMPADICGTQVFSFQESRFHLVPGPVFTNILLADEINRAPAKTQSALLEAMQERQVSIEGETRPLPDPFFVLATENPVEHEGTYPLPEAQLDRFLFQVTLDYPSLEEERRILELYSGENARFTDVLATVVPVADAEALRLAREEVRRVTVRPEVTSYLLELVRRTRDDVDVRLGASPRAALLLQVASKAAAAMAGRDYVIPDDVKSLYLPALRHRVVLAATAEVEGRRADDVLRRIAESVEVPR